MLKLITITLISFFVVNSYAGESLGKEKLSCLFEKPFIFGASISAGYKDLTDATAVFSKLSASQYLGGEPHYLGGNPGPITRLARKYHLEPQITNIAEIINQMKYGSVGATQFMHYISDPSNEENLRQSSVIASIDGLYWPTIYGSDCSHTDYAISGTRRIIRYAKDNGIVLLLGNVPDEDPTKVSALLRGNEILPANWHPPKVQCLRKVNQFLRTECNLEDQCYIIDLHGIVENLKGRLGPRDKVGVWFQGERYRYNDFRSDGVHLWNPPEFVSDDKNFPTSPEERMPHEGEYVPDGMRYLMTYIEKSIGWNLPYCSQ